MPVPCKYTSECHQDAVCKGLCKRHYMREYMQRYSARGAKALKKARRRYRTSPTCKRQKKLYYKNNKSRYRDCRLRRKYGITLKDYEKMRAAQKGRCAICGEVTEYLVVDHNHATGATRWLLCGPCNCALWPFEKTKKWVRAALRYLASWS